jgi:microsomal dipeptidase-like Zn-dependent dipeptidase
MVLLAVVLLGALVAGALRGFAVWVARSTNSVALSPPYVASAQATALHRRIPIVDLHADSLLWSRDLARRGHFGHVDLPRLREGNVSLPVFSAVTKVPFGLNFERNSARGDQITLLAAAQGWPARAWRSPLHRALHQADRLRRLAADSNGGLLLIEGNADLDRLIALRTEGVPVIGAMLAVEGSHALDGRLENLDLLHHAGFRMIGLHHFFDNEAGGSAHGLDGGGLTEFGRDLIGRLEDRRMLIDVAHSSPKVLDDVLALATRPIFVSHTGLRGTADNQRNLSDEHVRGIAAAGGVIGITMFAHAVGGSSVDDTARAMRFGADLVGVEHIGLGTDFDGAVETSVDVTGLPLLTESLLRHGFDQGEVGAIMGGNALRVLREGLS